MPYKDPIKRKEYDKQYWAKNSEKRLLQHKVWKQNNPVRAKELVDEQRRACHFTNLQPLWAVENFSKGAKIL